MGRVVVETSTTLMGWNALIRRENVRDVAKFDISPTHEICQIEFAKTSSVYLWQRTKNLPTQRAT